MYEYNAIMRYFMEAVLDGSVGHGKEREAPYVFYSPYCHREKKEKKKRK